VAGRLDGRVAVVTGSGQGIGRGIAHALAREGCAVSLSGRHADNVESVAAELEGSRVLASVCDVGQRDDVEAMVARTNEELGTIDVVVNNAQGGKEGEIPIDVVSEAQVLEAFRTGPLGSLFVTQACLPSLRVRGGSVVNMGSSLGISGAAGYGAYAMAKEAIRAFTKVAARELGPHGIRVNTICPAAMSASTERFIEDYPDEFGAFLRSSALRRIGDPELDIGRAVVALVSDDFRYLTGATLMLDGGQLCAV
jgi:NAD(P)-dependent dehydrogenase (short-subunit alcohol dehydrogenase family)